MKLWLPHVIAITCAACLVPTVGAAGIDDLQQQAAELFERFDANRDDLLDEPESKAMSMEKRVWLEQNGFSWDVGATRDEFLAVVPFLLHSVASGNWDAEEAELAAKQAAQESTEQMTPSVASNNVQNAEQHRSSEQLQDWKFERKLPPDYISRDRNNDQQLGLYEWPTQDLGLFLQIDANNDGFLTPRELLRHQKKN